MTSGRKKSVFTRGRIAFITSIAAILALVIFSGLCISHPAFAKDVPLVGDVFASIGYKLGFGGSYDSYATPISSDENGNPGELSSSINNTTVTLQDIYCDGKSMYISVAVESKDAFPVDQIYEIDGLKRLEVFNSKGLENFEGKDDYFVFHSGTKFNDEGKVVTNGGRVIGVTALGSTLVEARANAYKATELIDFENKYMRHDIGKAIDEK